MWISKNDILRLAPPGLREMLSAESPGTDTDSEDVVHVDYIDDPFTYAWIDRDTDTITISVDGNYNAESMRILGNHLLALSKRLEQPSPTDDVHNWFELSYAQYLTVPRSVLQSMPSEWQRKFVALLEEMDETIDWRPKEGRYWVRLKDSKGRYVADPLMDYEHGRRLVEHKGLQEKGQDHAKI